MDPKWVLMIATGSGLAHACQCIQAGVFSVDYAPTCQAGLQVASFSFKALGPVPSNLVHIEWQPSNSVVIVRFLCRIYNGLSSTRIHSPLSDPYIIYFYSPDPLMKSKCAVKLSNPSFLITSIAGIRDFFDSPFHLIWVQKILGASSWVKHLTRVKPCNSPNLAHGNDILSQIQLCAVEVLCNEPEVVHHISCKWWGQFIGFEKEFFTSFSEFWLRRTENYVFPNDRQDGINFICPMRGVITGVYLFNLFSFEKSIQSLLSWQSLGQLYG